MEELAAARKETEKKREKVGAVDVRPGEGEGMGMVDVRDEDKEDGGSGSGNGVAVGTGTKSRAMEKRKRDLEERRKALDAKRRKVKGLPAVEDGPSPSVAFASVHAPTSATEVTSATPSDALASLEAKIQSSSGGGPGLSAADDFLAQLERDMAKQRRV
jgi:hypothetical protein